MHPQLNSSDNTQSAAVKMTNGFRSVGWWFLVGGSIICIHPIVILFDPQAPILVNGSPTTDLNTKLSVTAFGLFFPLLGAFLALTPRKKLERLFASFIRWSRTFARGHK